MKTQFVMLLALVAGLALTAPAIAAGPGSPGTIGTCPNPAAPDADGDGIPNGQDPDYVPPRDGTGRQLGTAAGAATRNQWSWGMGRWFSRQWQALTRFITAGSGWGPGDGSGNDGVGPHDGTGYGPGPRDLRNCDGTGNRWMQQNNRP